MQGLQRPGSREPALHLPDFKNRRARPEAALNPRPVPSEVYEELGDAPCWGDRKQLGVWFPPYNTERLGLGAVEEGFEFLKAAHLASKIKIGFPCVFLIRAVAKYSLGSEQPQALETAQCIDLNLNFGKEKKKRHLLANPWV